MRVPPIALRFLLITTTLLIAPTLRAEPREAVKVDVADRVEVPAKFMRYNDDPQAGGRFETAVVTFKNKDGVTVRLVGAIHVGEKSYYEALNKSFEDDDAVLFELVRSKAGGIPHRGEESSNIISQFQHAMKDVLNLDFQLDDIDYTKANFVHADMDAETFAKMQEERGETFQQLMLKAIMKSFTPGKDDDKSGEADEDPQKMIDEAIETFTRPDMERRVKVAVAKQLDKVENNALGLDNPNGSVILTERNKVAMKVLETTIADGKKHISIFYGAAHMPDMSTRVMEMGFKPVRVEWNTAWDLRIRPDQPSGAEKLLKGLLHAFD